MKLALAAALCGVIAAPTAALAADPLPNRWEIGVQGGAGAADGSLTGTGREFGPVAGMRLAYLPCDTWSWFADLTYGQFDGRRGVRDETLAVWTLRTGPEFYLSKPGKPTQWFAQLAAGMTRFNFDNNALDADRALVSAGFGQKYYNADKSANFYWVLRADKSLGDSRAVGSPLNAQLLIGYAWGVGKKVADADADGVPDCRDNCANTPAGCLVDEGGCPKDEDGDGVCDGVDKCPGTPKGWPVDKVGCPLDTDGDGVADGKDQCPNTPKGCTVNDVGCPSDSDGDGVCDGVDQCQNTPKGCKVDGKGCPSDADGDGVCDGVDQCPNSPKDCKVDAKGCTLDEDGDGVCDSKDKCPGTPKGVKVDANGCPPLIVEKGQKLILKGVNFDFDKATLRPESFPILDEVAASLKSFPEVKVEIGGHTDSKGTKAYNLKLSDRRAKTVLEYLVGKGVGAGQLATKGYGMAEPVADNKTEEGRFENRRVELKRLD